LDRGREGAGFGVLSPECGVVSGGGWRLTASDMSDLSDLSDPSGNSGNQPIERVNERSERAEPAAETSREEQTDQQNDCGADQRDIPGARGDGRGEARQRVYPEEELQRKPFFADFRVRRCALKEG